MKRVNMGSDRRRRHRQTDGASYLRCCSLPRLLVLMTLSIQCGMAFLWTWWSAEPVVARAQPGLVRAEPCRQSNGAARAELLDCRSSSPARLRIDQAVLDLTPGSSTAGK